MRRKPQIRISWIVMETKKEAEDILQKLAEGEDFALMAKTTPSTKIPPSTGGDLGLIDRGRSVCDPNMLEAAAKLNDRRMSGTDCGR